MRQQLLINLTLKNCDSKLIMKDCEWTKEERELIFSPIKFIVFKRAWLKKVYSAIVAHLFFEILESKSIPRGIFQTRDYFKQKLSKKM